MSSVNIQKEFVDKHKKSLHGYETFIIHNIPLDGKVRIEIGLEIDKDDLKTNFSQGCMLSHEQMKDDEFVEAIIETMFEAIMMVYKVFDSNREPPILVRKPWRAGTFN